ncbi:hypothetical protein B5G52_12280 [Pseudoalteromonas sp. A601]|nr:hypothetical protein B5G52_12280 [Pseudoalteromonas sp. A601]
MKFSAIDLIYSLDKTFYFLEMNPNGQWAWIEQITKQGIRKAITSELIKNEIKNA